MQSFDTEAVGRKIKEERIAKGIKAKDLAEKLFCDPSQISRLESGETAGNIPKLVLVANALDIDVRKLIEAGIEDIEDKEYKEDK